MGEIWVRGRVKDDGYVVRVRDNGGALRVALKVSVAYCLDELFSHFDYILFPHCRSRQKQHESIVRLM